MQRGFFDVVIGGFNNESAGDHAVTVGGDSNTAGSGSHFTSLDCNVVVGGFQNEVSQTDHCTLLGGAVNKTQLEWAALLGGNNSGIPSR